MILPIVTSLNPCDALLTCSVLAYIDVSGALRAGQVSNCLLILHRTD
jgi:hypothetical protein